MTTTATTTAAATVAAARRIVRSSSTQQPSKVDMSKAADVAAAHVSQCKALTVTAAENRKAFGTATEAAIEGLIAIFGNLPRQQFLDTALDAYKAAETWPKAEDGHKVGEKDAGEDGKAYVRLRVMVNDRFNEDGSKRNDAQLKVHRSEKAARSKERKAELKSQELATAMKAAGVIAQRDVTADMAFDMFIAWFDSLDAAATAFSDMVKSRKAKLAAATTAATEKLVGRRAAHAAAAAAPVAAAAAARSKKAAAKDAARKLVDKAGKVSANLANLAGKRAVKTIKAAEAAEAIAADNARVESSNAAAAAETLK